MKDAAKYCAGEISFNEFAARNHKDWMRMARYLLRRFPTDHAAEEDVAQELLLGCWQSLARFDPARGVTADRYAVFNAMRRAKRRIVRTALRPAGELLLDEVEDERVLPSEQVEAVERARRLNALVQQCSTLTEAVCLMVYFREEECTLAAASIYADVELRRLCQLGSPRDATRKMRRTLQRVCPHEEEPNVES